MSWLRRRPVRLPQDLPSSLEPPEPEPKEEDLIAQLVAALSGNRGPAALAPIAFENPPETWIPLKDRSIDQLMMKPRWD